MTRIIRFDCYEVHLDTGQIYRRGARLRLPEQPFRVLAELLEHPGDLVTRGELRRRLWPGDVFVDFEAALNTAVAKAREALADSAAQPRFIETLPKRGYRFIAPVSEPAQPAQPAPLRRARLLVLPFANPSGDPAQEYFSDAMTDEVITALAGLSPDVLAVIARTTAMHYKHSRKDIAGIARELNLDYIVEGAARRAGDDVSLNVQLIRASDQAHVWARRYDVPLAAVFGAHSAISRAIGEEVGVAASDKLHSDTAVRKPTADLAAYTLYQQGRHHFYRATPGGFAAAKQCYEQAIARDPRFALAYDALAELYFYLGFLGFAPLKEVTATGMFCALRALEIDNTLAETHALFGMYRRDIDSDSEMKRALDRARELRPWSPLVKLRYAISWLMPSGRLEEAITELEGALERDPLAMMVRTWLGVMFWLRREYDRAIEQARLVVEIEPASYIGYWHLGCIPGKRVHSRSRSLRTAAPSNCPTAACSCSAGSAWPLAKAGTGRRRARCSIDCRRLPPARTCHRPALRGRTWASVTSTIRSSGWTARLTPAIPC